MPLDLGHDIARLVPAMRLVAEAGVVTSYLVRWSPDWRVTTRLARFPGSAPGYGHYARRYYRQDPVLEIACSRCERCGRFQVRDGCRQIDHCAGAAAVTKCPISGRYRTFASSQSPGNADRFPLPHSIHRRSVNSGSIALAFAGGALSDTERSSRNQVDPGFQAWCDGGHSAHW